MINHTIDQLKILTNELKELKCFHPASFIRKHTNHAVTFALLAVEGRQIPWNSNIIERLMGEIPEKNKT
jgi:transposase-like protein